MRSDKISLNRYTAENMCVFGVFLVRIQSKCGKIRSRKTPNTDTIHAVILRGSQEAVAQRCSVKKVFLKISQNSQENNCARVSFLIKLQTEA